MQFFKKTFILLTLIFFATLSTIVVRSTTSTVAWLNNGTNYHEWQAITLTYTAQNNQVDPLDYTTVNFTAEISHSDGKGLMTDATPTIVHGYFDGGKTWRLRFTPTRQGLWTIKTSFVAPIPDASLHNKISTVTVLPAQVSSPEIFKIGGFLKTIPKTDSTRGWLAYSNGSPFFWLAYKAHTILGTDGTLEDYRRIIANAANRGYSVYQFSGLNQNRTYTIGSQRITGNAYTFASVADGIASTSSGKAMAAKQYWDDVEHIIRFGAQNGLIASIGIGSYEMSERHTIEEQKRMWAYLQARLGSYPITAFFAQEYNTLHKPASSNVENPCAEDETFVIISNLRRCAFSATTVQERIDNYFDLVEFFKQRDPYDRAVTLHAAVLDQTLCGGQNTNRRSCTLPETVKNYQDWFASSPTDFIMIQVGHRLLPSASLFSEMRRIMNAENISKPFIIEEFNYEGFADEAVVTTRDGQCSYSRKGKVFRNASGTLLPLDTTVPHIYTDDAHIRNSMTVSMHSEAAGYTYAAQGVFNMIIDKNVNPKTAPNWGPVLNWNEGLQLAGARSLQFILSIMHRYPVQHYVLDSSSLVRTGNLNSFQSVLLNTRTIGGTKAYLVSYIAPVRQPCLPTDPVLLNDYLAKYYSGYSITNARMGSTFIARFMSTRSDVQWERILSADALGNIAIPNIATQFASDYTKLLNYDLILHLETVESAKGLRPFITAYNSNIDRYVHTTHPETLYSFFAEWGYTDNNSAFYLPMYSSFAPRNRQYVSRNYTELETTPLWQMYNRGQKVHRFVIESPEYDALIAAGWEDNGIKGYVFTQAGYRREKMLRLIPAVDDGSRHYVVESQLADLEEQGWTNDETFGEAFVVVDPLDV